MTTDTAQQVVTFRLGGDHFAADIYTVERVLRFTPPTPVPNLPEWVEGVIDYQGRVVPVIDLRRRFGVGDGRPEGRIVIFAARGDWIGAIVDAVLEVMTLPSEGISDPPALFRGLQAEYLRGLVRRDGRLIIVLDIERLLTATESIALDRALRDGLDG